MVWLWEFWVGGGGEWKRPKIPCVVFCRRLLFRINLPFWLLTDFCICFRCETFPYLWYDEVPQRSLCWLEFYLILLSRIYIFSCNFLLLLYLEFLDCEINHILWVTCVNREDYLKKIPFVNQNTSFYYMSVDVNHEAVYMYCD